MSIKLVRDRSKWYREGCDGLEDRDGYWTSGDLLRDVADDIDRVLSATEAVVTKVAAVKAELIGAWRETGACISYAEDRDVLKDRCANCGRSRADHRLLKLADQLGAVLKAVQ